jgi:hypothetical protein
MNFVFLFVVKNLNSRLLYRTYLVTTEYALQSKNIKSGIIQYICDTNIMLKLVAFA